MADYIMSGSSLFPMSLTPFPASYIADYEIVDEGDYKTKYKVWNSGKREKTEIFWKLESFRSRLLGRVITDVRYEIDSTGERTGVALILDDGAKLICADDDDNPESALWIDEMNLEPWG